MIRNKVSIERQINDRLYQFLIPFEATLGECALIMEDVKKYISDRIAEEEKKEKEKKEEAVIPEIV